MVKMSYKRVFYVMFVVLVAGVSAIAGALAGSLAVYKAVTKSPSVYQENSATDFQAISAAAQSSSQTLVLNSTEIVTAITKVVENVGSAVVTVTGTIPGEETFFGRTSDQTVSGSGFFITEDGYLLTNNHVIDGAQNVSAILADGRQIDAQIIGMDLFSDLAVLKIEDHAPEVAVLGNSDLLKSGESVVAIGSPLGEFKNSVTVGVVSGTGRSIDTGDGYSIENLIQTDAAINQGNSGGPLVNIAGEVIGINTLIVRSSGSGTVAEGLGFAIPINTARAIAKEIMEKGYFARPYVGIGWQSITPDIAARYQLPVEWGIYVTKVYSNSPASDAGIEVGDIIYRIDDITLDENHSYINTLFLHRPGEEVILGIYRNDEMIELKAILGEAKRE